MTRRSIVCLLLALLWTAVAAWRGGAWRAPTAPRRLDPRRIRVLDGDTLRLGGRTIRLAGVDTPEKAAPWFDGDQEPWAGRASAFVRQALDRARVVTLRTRGRRDRFGRELAHVLVDGESLSVLLAEAGLAYPTVDRYGDGGFPALADAITRRARRPEFPPPWRWRKTHRLQ